MGVLKQTTVEFDSAEDLVGRIAAGDPAAEAMLYRRYAQGILFLLRQRCPDPTIAEDLLHETFRIVIERLRRQSLDNPERLSAYLHKVAINLVIGEIRRVQRRNTHFDHEAIIALVDTQPDMIEQIDQEDLSRIVRQLLKEMTMRRDRDLLSLYYIQELDKPRICQELELSSEHFDRVLYRAKQRFRTVVESYLGKRP